MVLFLICVAGFAIWLVFYKQYYISRFFLLLIGLASIFLVPSILSIIPVRRLLVGCEACAVGFSLNNALTLLVFLGLTTFAMLRGAHTIESLLGNRPTSLRRLIVAFVAAIVSGWWAFWGAPVTFFDVCQRAYCSLGSAIFGLDLLRLLGSSINALPVFIFCGGLVVQIRSALTLSIR
jgi:hypothetical protein